MHSVWIAITFVALVLGPLLVSASTEWKRRRPTILSEAHGEAVGDAVEALS